MDKATRIDAFVVAAYATGQNEDGNFEYQCGWNVIAKTMDGNIQTEWISWDGDYPTLFANDEAEKAEDFADAVVRAGVIDPKNWTAISERRVGDLPDYVTDWSNPIYN